MDYTKVTHTIEGYLVKDLRFKPVDNIIVGLCKDPIHPIDLHNGFVAMQWTRQGKPLRINKGRTDLILNFNE